MDTFDDQFGWDFSIINITDQYGNVTLDIDFTNFTNDPSIVLNSDLGKIYASPGDYDWDPAVGSGLLTTKGARYTQQYVDGIKTQIDLQSAGDDRIRGYSTDVSIDSGDVSIAHKIILNNNASFSSDIKIAGQSVSTILGQ
jgi:hypothetical protein